MSNAAALALTGLTAMNSVDDTLKLKRGETILIQGGAGGVAGFAIQFAKHIGARVITTASTRNLDYVRSLGADEVIDYTTTDFTKVVSGVDAVFETVGGDVAEKSFAVLKPGGRAAFIASGAQAPKPDRADVIALRPPVGRARAPLERIAALFLQGADPRARGQALSPVRGGRRPPGERRPPPARQARLPGAVRRGANNGSVAAVHARLPCRQGAKISFAADAEAPGVGPPEMTYSLPPTTAAPRPCRAVGMRAWLLQPLLFAS